MTMTRLDAAKLLMEKDRYVILTHKGPDGDTTGSAALLCLGLRQLGKTAHVYYNEEWSPKYLFLVEALQTNKIGEDDTLVCVDVPAEHMLVEFPEEHRQKLLLRIDHHGNAQSFTPNEVVEPQTASCGELVYEILKLMQVELNEEMALPLYTAITTDTGCFRYANTTAHTLQTAAACYETGAQLQELTRIYFDTITRKSQLVRAFLLENAVELLDGRVMICSMTMAQEQEMELTPEDTHNLAGFARSIEGVCMAVMLREYEENRISLSVRAIPGWDAAAFCNRFGGGGHKGAAGAGFEGTMQEAVAAVRKAVEEGL